MKQTERPLHRLKINEMRLDELRKELSSKKGSVIGLSRAALWAKGKVKEIESEIKNRPRTRSYKPGLYWGHTNYSTKEAYYESREELVIVDPEGYPWMLMSNGWYRFGKGMNRTAERVWERISDL